MYKKLDETLVETTIDNHNNVIDDIDSIDDNIKNLKRETKLSEYCKKAKKENEDCHKFLSMDKKQEEAIKVTLDGYYDVLLRGVVEKVLKSEGLYERWFEKIYDLTKRTISQVNPSFKDLKDSMDINDYVKIKTIPYRDFSLCKVIDGFAFQKNVCSKKMQTTLENPKILLLDCGLDYNRTTDKITNYVENLMTQETAYFNIIMKKIGLVQPTVILVNKNVSLKIREDFSTSNKISLVMNVKSKSLKKIARCTKTYVLPSTDLIDKQTILGTCKKFRVEKIKLKNEENKNDILKTNEYNLMIFEGCDYLLHCTIILSGPDKEELKLLKRLMRTILLTARDLYLQKFVLYFSYCDIQPNVDNQYNEPLSRQSISSSKNSSVSNLAYNSMISTSALANNLSKKHNVILNNALNCLNKFEMESFYFLKDFTNGFDASILMDRNRVFQVKKLTLAQGNTQQPINFDRYPNYPIDKFQPGTFTGNTGDLAEQEILKLVNSICEQPQDLELIFYSDQEYYDKPLGKLIIDLCMESDVKCESCNKKKSSHIYYMYKKFGRIKIQMVQSQDDYLEAILELINRESLDFSKYNSYYKPDKQALNYSMDIFSYGICKICQKIVTPLIKIPREMFNFSVAKYFKYILFNHEVRQRTDKSEFNLTKFYIASNECTHYFNKDISRIFVTKMGAVKFAYENSPIYLIETSPLNERRDHGYFTVVLETYIKIFREKSIDVLECLKVNFKQILEDVSELVQKSQIEDLKWLNFVKESVEKITRLGGKYYNIVSEIMNFIENAFGIPSRFEDYVKAIVYIKKVYFRIVQVKIVQNFTRKTIRKIKNAINYMNKMKVLAQQFDKENSINVGYLNQSGLLPLDDAQGLINIDNKESYRSILKEISFFDDHHNKYSSDINEDDLSSIIAYTLTSDKYREHISPNNRFKLIDIKCDRRIKQNVDINLNNFLNLEREKSSDVRTAEIQIRNDETNEHKYGYNFFTTQDEEVYDTSLLFDQSKNTYQYQNLDNHKINQQLETELLSDEKTHFLFSAYTYNLMNHLTTWNMPIEINTNSPKPKKEIKSSSNLAKQSSELPIENLNIENISVVMEEKYILQGDNIRATLEELESIKIEAKVMKDLNKQIVDNKTKDKHKKFDFAEESLLAPIECEIIVYYPRQFESLRITYCATYDDFILSIAKSNVWSDVTGGKSKADFYKSHDNRYILKCVNKHEFKMFIETGFQYFHHNAKFLFHKMPSALAKILGAYKIKIKNNRTNRAENSYIILMENLFYGKEETGISKYIKAYDLKGSKSNRYISKKDQKANQVLPDTNFKEDFKGEPIALERNMAELLKAAIHNDSLILSKMNVVDYSLLLIIDEKCALESMADVSGRVGGLSNFNIKSIRVGIIDYVRKYTWDKQLEHVGKIIINRLQVPTIVNPVNYKERFKEAIDDFFIGI